MTIEELTKASVEKIAAAQAEQTLDRDIRHIIRVAQMRQQIYSQALEGAQNARYIENLDTRPL
jgi:hypothetical protein